MQIGSYDRGFTSSIAPDLPAFPVAARAVEIGFQNLFLGFFSVNLKKFKNKFYTVNYSKIVNLITSVI